MTILRQACAAWFLFALSTFFACAAELPPAKENDWIAKDFRFHTGEILPEVRFHYTTLGSPSNEAVLVLHGTAGSGNGMLTPAFAGELFGPGLHGWHADMALG